MRLALSSQQEEKARPVFNEARCVHDRVAGASCKACADACPVDALALGEDALELRVDACIGCMLCAAACPQEAIDSGLPRLDAALLRRGKTAFLTCQHSGAGTAKQSVPCMHALSWRDALRLHAAGVRQIAVALGDCGGCEPRAARLDRTLAHVNELLSSRRLPELEVQYLTNEQFKSEIRGASAVAMSPRRRAFLRRMVDPGHQQRESGAPATVAALLGESDPTSSVFPAVPVIDAHRCDGCDACTRTCPTGALSLLDEDGLCYRVDASRCTGCNLCIDVCQPGAISVNRWATSAQQALALHSRRCSACGIDYHAPGLTSDTLCTICAKTNHHRKLFQVDPA